MFDPSKPVQTRDGRPARILATDRKAPVGSPLSIIALVENNHGYEFTAKYDTDGRARLSPSMSDLVNVPMRTTRSFNVYFSDTGSSPAVNEARYGTMKGRLTIDVEIEDGVPVSVKLVTSEYA
jgi:hypothetical protein